MNINMGVTFHSFCFCHIGSCREVLTGSWFARNKITLRDFVLYVCNGHRWLHPWASEMFTTKFSPLLWAVWELSRCGRCTAPSREPSAYHILRELRLLFFLDAVCSFYDYCSALNHAKVYHVIQVVRVSTPVNFHSSETGTRAHMVRNKEYNNTNTFPTGKVEWFRSNKRHRHKQQIDDHIYLLMTL